MAKKKVSQFDPVVANDVTQIERKLTLEERVIKLERRFDGLKDCLLHSRPVSDV